MKIRKAIIAVAGSGTRLLPATKAMPKEMLAIVDKPIIQYLEGMKKGKSGEIRLADAFDLMLRENKALCGKKLEGEWLDTGEKLTYITTTIKMGLKHPEIGNELKSFIKCLDITGAPLK